MLARTAKVGAIVSAASGALFRIAENGEIELEAAVSETTLARIRSGQTVDVLPAGAVEPVRGTVRLVSPEVDAATRLGKVRIALPPSETLRSGAFARGTVELARSNGLALPVSAVLTSGDAPVVQVVKNGKVETRTVETGLSGGGFVEIRKGLAAGEEVVARSGTFLRDGDAVAPVQAKVEGAKDELELLRLGDPQSGPLDPPVRGALRARRVVLPEPAITKFPNIDVPVISVTITDSGSAPSELETQVTKKVEDSIAGLTGVKHITSTVTDGQSTTAVEFRWRSTPTARSTTSRTPSPRFAATCRRPSTSRSSSASTSRGRRSSPTPRRPRPRRRRNSPGSSTTS